MWRLLAVCTCLFLFLTSQTDAQTQEIERKFAIFTAQPIANQEARPGETIHLSCNVATGEILHWLRDGEQISTNNSAYTIQGGNLTITSFQYAFAGSYRCVATRDGNRSRQISQAGRVSLFSQRDFTVQPDNFTTYEDTSTGRFPEAPFKCKFGAAYNGVRPVITWEVRRSGESVKSVSLPDLQAQRAAIDSDSDPLSRFRLGADTVTYRQVIFQRDHTGHFQLHFPDRSADDRMNVRCVATHPDDPSQSVRSNWATLFVQDGPIPANTAVFTSHPPPTVFAIEGQDLVMDCTKGIRNITKAVRWLRDGNVISDQGVSVANIPGGSPYGYTNYYLNTSSPHFSSYIGSSFSCVIMGTDSTTQTMSVQVTTETAPSIQLRTSQVNYQITEGFVILVGFVLSLPTPPPLGHTGQWWFNGQSVVIDGSKYSINSVTKALTVVSAVISDAGVYQWVDTPPGAYVSNFANYHITIDGGTKSAVLHWNDPSETNTLFPGSPTGYGATPSFSDRLHINSNGSLVSAGRLAYTDIGTYAVLSNDYLVTGILQLAISVAGSEELSVHWRDPSTTSILPMAPATFTVTPQLSSRLQVNAAGQLVSSGQLQSSDGGTFLFQSSEFLGSFNLTLIISVTETIIVDLNWAEPTSVTILPTAPSGYQLHSFSSTQLSVDSSGVLSSFGQLQARDAGLYPITSNDFSGTLSVLIRVNITGSSTHTLHWSNPTTISLLPVSNNGYNSTPPFSSRLTVTTAGQLVSQGNLEASDSNTVTISSSDFVGSYQTTIHISINGSMSLVLSSSDPTTVKILPVSFSEYHVTPPFSSRVQVNSSGHLVSSGQLQASDAGTYTITSSDFSGALTVEVQVNITGSSTETLHWSYPTTISLLPTSNTGYQVTPAFSSRLTVTTLGQLVSQGNLEASDSNIVTISSSDFVGSYQTTIHISINGSRPVLLSRNNSATEKILPVSHSGYHVDPPFSSRLDINLSGYLVPNGPLQASDGGTYTITSFDFVGSLTLSLTIFFGDIRKLTVHWREPTSFPLLPAAPSGYQVTPPFSSRLHLSSLGELISNGQLQGSDGGEYNITSAEYSGTFLLILQISIKGSESFVLHWDRMTSFPILPVSSSEYQVNPPFIVNMETHHPRLRVNSSGHFISNGQLQSDDITTVPHLISSSEFTDELTVSLKINISDEIVIETMWMTPLSRKVLPARFPMENHTRFMIDSSGTLVSDGLLLEDSNTYSFSAPSYEGHLVVHFIVNAPGYVITPIQDTAFNKQNGSTVLLSCEGKAYPLPVWYIWKREGMQIANTSDGRLELKEVIPSHVGEYLCCPNNMLGNFNCSSAVVSVEIDLTLVWLTRHSVNLFPHVRSGYNCTSRDRPEDEVPFEITREGDFVTTSLDLTGMGHYDCVSAEFSGVLTIDLELTAHSPIQPSITMVEILRNGSMNVSWTDTSMPTRPVDKYVLEINTVPHTQDDSRARQIAGERTMVVETGNAYHIIEVYNRGLRYRFRIRAENSAGATEFSEPHHYGSPPTEPIIVPEPSFPVWAIVLIILLLLLCCTGCCFLLILVLCYHRRKHRKVYRAEEREVKYGRDFKKKFKVGDEDNNSIEVSSDFASVENIYQQNERATTRGEQEETGQTASRDDGPTELKPISGHGVPVGRKPTYTLQSDV